MPIHISMKKEPVINPSEYPDDTQWTDFEAHMPRWGNMTPLGKAGLLSGSVAKNILMPLEQDKEGYYRQSTLSIGGFNSSEASEVAISNMEKDLNRFSGKPVDIEEGDVYILGGAYNHPAYPDVFNHEYAHYLSDIEGIDSILDKAGVKKDKNFKNAYFVYKEDGKPKFVQTHVLEHLLIYFEQEKLSEEGTNSNEQAKVKLNQLLEKTGLSKKEVERVYDNIVQSLDD